MREFTAVEDVANRYEEVENVHVDDLQPAANETPAHRILHKVLRQQPNVLVIRDLVDSATVAAICGDLGLEEHMYLVTVRARDAVEAVLKVLAIDKPVPDAAKY